MTSVIAQHGSIRRPSSGALGVLAAITPITMLLAWLAVTGWDVTSRSFAFAAVEYTIGGVSAGWIVGSRVDRSVAGHIIGLAAYGVVGWLVLLPINAAGAVWNDLQGGPMSDALAIVVAGSGYLLYGLIVGVSVFAFLLPVGAGWIVTFLLVRRAFDR
jgi:hypothetical protein